MNYASSPKIAGYHGTYPENVDSIKENNFFETENHTIWLGDGVYFFVDGVNTRPAPEYAKLYAIDNCYDKDKKQYSKEHVVVLEAYIKINDDKFLDLTNYLGNQLFNRFRDAVIRKIEDSGKKIIGEYNDTDVLKIMRRELGIEFVKSNLYIKFALQRILKFNSLVPNVTVLVVNNPKKNIQKPSIKEIIKHQIL